jgi:hypothetical protein
MEKQKQVGADDLGWRFHLYHFSWVIGLILLFFIFDWWIAFLILGSLSVYFVWKY